MVLKRIGAASLAKIAGTLYLMLGFIIGGIISLVSILGLASKPNDDSAAYGLLFGAGAVILFPVFYGFIGFVAALLMASLYNWLARWLGGVQLELE